MQYNMFGNGFADTLGFVALIITTIYTFLGLPSQILRNYKKKSTEGLSLFLIVMLSLTFCVWSLYSYFKVPRDYYILFSNSPGFFFSVVVLLQFWIYKKR